MKNLIIILSVLFLYACKKDNGSSIVPQCDVRGTYAGNATASGGGSSPMVYQLSDNNFAVGSVTVGGTPTTFGGYRNSCDSVIISSYYNGNGSYYLLKGILSNNRTIITGTFNNLTIAGDFGTFTMTKQ
jgi:hypothetical protein